MQLKWILIFATNGQSQNTFNGLQQMLRKQIQTYTVNISMIARSAWDHRQFIFLTI